MLCLVISMMRMTIIILTIYKKHIGKILRGPVPGGAGPWRGPRPGAHSVYNDDNANYDHLVPVISALNKTTLFNEQ